MKEECSFCGIKASGTAKMIGNDPELIGEQKHICDGCITSFKSMMIGEPDGVIDIQQLCDGDKNEV